MGFQENDKIRTCNGPWQGNSHQEEWAWTSSSNHPLASLTLNLFLHNFPKYQHKIYQEQTYTHKQARKKNAFDSLWVNMKNQKGKEIIIAEHLKKSFPPFGGLQILWERPLEEETTEKEKRWDGYVEVSIAMAEEWGLRRSVRVRALCVTICSILIRGS